MSHPLRSLWTRKLAVVVFATATLVTSGASAQGSFFGIPIPRVEQGPNSSVIVTIAPGAPAVRLPGLPDVAPPAPQAAPQPSPPPYAPAEPPPFAAPAPAPVAPPSLASPPGSSASSSASPTTRTRAISRSAPTTRCGCSAPSSMRA